MTRRAAQLAHRPKSHGTLSPVEWAQIIAEEARALNIKMTPKEIAEGVGIISYESSFNADNFVQGAGGHIGAWSESPTFGGTKERLDPRASTRAAIKNWASSGKSWWPAWGRWQAEQRPDGQAGSTQWKKYIGFAEHALGVAGAGPGKPKPSPKGKPEPEPEDFGKKLTHIGLVGALVLGGAAMIGLGTTRVFGTAQTKGAR